MDISYVTGFRCRGCGSFVLTFFLSASRAITSTHQILYSTVALRAVLTSYTWLDISLMYPQTAEFRPDNAFVLLALIAIASLFALEFKFLLPRTPFSDQAVHDVEAVRVLGVAAFPLFDPCGQLRPLRRAAILQVLLFRTPLFEMGEARVLVLVLLQFARQGALGEALELE
jgi:hypothetical protein